MKFLSKVGVTLFMFLTAAVMLALVPFMLPVAHSWRVVRGAYEIADELLTQLAEDA